jgi:hypothetical protein
MAGTVGTDAGNTEKGGRPETKDEEEIKPLQIIRF